MSKIVDPIIDYFLQIPLSEGNILQFLSHNGFNVSKVQNPDGSTKSLLFYHVSYPSKSVQFNDDGKGVENFLSLSQQSLFFILDDTEMTFILKAPREERGIAMEKGDTDMRFSARKVRYTGEQSNTLNELTGDNTVLHLTKTSNTFELPHAVMQKIFISFITEKKLLTIEDLLRENRNIIAKPVDDMYCA